MDQESSTMGWLIIQYDWISSWPRGSRSVLLANIKAENVIEIERLQLERHG